MQIKDNLTEEEAFSLSESLMANDNTADVIKMASGKYCVSWIKNKKYISVDGKEYTDEVWTKEDGTMLAIQDIDLAHARNIIRRILRKDREFIKATSNIFNQLASALGVDHSDSDIPTNRILH